MHKEIEEIKEVLDMVAERCRNALKTLEAVGY